jgi:hypothetical protein
MLRDPEGERDIGEAGFVSGIATPDIGVIAGERIEILIAEVRFFIALLILLSDPKRQSLPYKLPEPFQ